MNFKKNDIEAKECILGNISCKAIIMPSNIEACHSFSMYSAAIELMALNLPINFKTHVLDTCAVPRTPDRLRLSALCYWFTYTSIPTF